MKLLLILLDLGWVGNQDLALRMSATIPAHAPYRAGDRVRSINDPSIGLTVRTVLPAITGLFDSDEPGRRRYVLECRDGNALRLLNLPHDELEPENEGS